MTSQSHVPQATARRGTQLLGMLRRKAKAK
jgi:hypothetical protein